MSQIIYDVFSRKKTSNRDSRLYTYITHWWEKNALSMSNGVIANVPMFNKDVRNQLEGCYNLDADDIKELNTCEDYKRLKFRVNKNLKIGLVISWIDTRDKIYLTILSVLVFSEIHRKYFPTFTGSTPKILEKVIDDQDDRTDFKKYNKSLLLVVNKRMLALEEWMKAKFKNGKYSDHDIIEAITSVDARYNGMMRILAVKTYEKIEQGIQVQTVQTTDANDKHVLSSSSELDSVAERVNEDLTYPSAKIMGFIYNKSKEHYALEKYYNATKFKKLGADTIRYIDTTAGTSEKSVWIDMLNKLSLTKSSKDVSDGIIDIVNEIVNKSDVQLNKRTLTELVIKYISVLIIYRLAHDDSGADD